MKYTINFLFLIIAGTWNAFAVQGQGLYIQPGGSLVASGDVLLTLQNCDLENRGIVDLTDGTLLMAGGGTAEIRSTSEITVSELTVDKPAGVVLLGAELDVLSRLNMLQGKLDLNQHDIHLSPGATLEGENEISHVTGLSGGIIYTEAALNQPAQADPGNLGIAITSANNLGLVTIRRGHKPQNTANDTESITRYYDIQTSGGNAVASLEFRYFDSELNGQTEGNLQFFKSADDGFSWNPVPATLLDATLNRASLSNTALPFRWTLAQTAANDSTTLLASQTAVSTAESNASLKAWPVPAAGFVYLQAEGITGHTPVGIFNAGGQLIRRLAVQPGQIQVLVDLIPGVYVARLGNYRNAQATIIIQ